MCTSFVIFSDKTFIGMNFDISYRPITLTLNRNDQLLVSQHDGSTFNPAFGLNRDGRFMNLLSVGSNTAGQYRRGRDVVHIIRIFEDYLNGKLDPRTLEILLNEKGVVNVPEYSLQSLVTGPDHYARIIEPGSVHPCLSYPTQKFLVLTNFPVSGIKNSNDLNPNQPGGERYQTCSRMLSESRFPFTVERGFEILEAVSQTSGDYPTQFSMLAIPQDDCLYFTLRRKFQKRYKFSFSNHSIHTITGFSYPHSCILDKQSIQLSELDKW